MRKLIVIALLFAVFAGAVYAQDLKLDGYFNSGIGIVIDNNEDNDAYFKALGVDSESNGYRFRLNGSYTNEAKNAGIRFRFQSQRNISAANTGYFSLAYAYGWVNFFDDKINLTGGIIDDSTWTTAEWWWNDDQGEGLGILLKLTPISGLNIGIGAYVISQQSGGNNNILSINNNGSLPNFRDITLKAEDTKYTFNAAYTMPDTFRLGASFRTKNHAGWRPPAPNTDDDYPYLGREETSQLIGEFRFLGVKDLTAVVIGIFDTLDDFNDAGNIILSETFGYKIDNLNLGLNAAQFLYNGKTSGKDTDPSLLFNLWGSYTLDSVVPRLDLVYFTGGRSKMTVSDKQWERRGFVNTRGAKGDDDDLSVFSIRPSVKINLDSKTFLEIGDMINIDNGNYDGAYKDSGNAKKNSLFTNVFYLDFKWSF